MPTDTDVAQSDEHERFRSFRVRLAGLRVLSDEVMHTLVQDATADPDPNVRGSMLALIADRPDLTHAQRQALIEDPRFHEPFLQHRIRRATLLALLQMPSLNDDVFTQCLSFSDAPVHQALLKHPGIGRLQLEALRDQGANRAVRNIAAQRLRARPMSSGGPNPGVQRTRFARR